MPVIRTLKPHQNAFSGIAPTESQWFADCRGGKAALSEGMQDRDVPHNCGRNSPLQQEGSNCALQGNAAGLEGRWFGGERTVLQLYRLTGCGITVPELRYKDQK